jgi:hypothetical protein
MREDTLNLLTLLLLANILASKRFAARALFFLSAGQAFLLTHFDRVFIYGRRTRAVFVFGRAHSGTDSR